jgi:GT2 family glycosyltransferase
MPQSQKPLVDIVMLVHDQAGWADLAIRAVEQFTRNDYRLIVVDSASKEPATHALLVEVEARGHTVVHLAENRSFSAGVNAGVQVGDAPFIVLLNDDAIVTEGWDTALLQDAAAKHVGLAGARSNFAAGAQGDPSFIGDPPFLVFVCVCLRRDVWNAVGPLDEVTFDGFSSEDLDYSWRVRKAGLALKVSSAYVLHAGSRTLAATVGPAVEQRARNDAKYGARLVEKWGKEHVAEHTKGPGRVFVVTYHAEEWTRVAFAGALLGLKRSDGVTFQFHNLTRAPIHMARNLAADYALDNGFDYLVQLDDDATFPPDVIRRLLSHGKDVVTALAYQRKPPHATCVFEIGEDGLLGKPMEGIEHTGLRKVDVSGFHCSIMRTSVVKRLRDAGIRFYYGGFENKVGEDFAMCLNLKKIGIPVHCDTDLISGHIGEAIVVDEDYKRRFVERGGQP